MTMIWEPHITKAQKLELRWECERWRCELKDNCDFRPECTRKSTRREPGERMVNRFRCLCDCVCVRLSHRWRWRRLRSWHNRAGCRRCRCKDQRPPLWPAGYSACGLNPAAGSLRRRHRGMGWRWGGLVSDTQSNPYSKPVLCAVTLVPLFHPFALWIQHHFPQRLFEFLSHLWTSICSIHLLFHHPAAHPKQSPLSDPRASAVIQTCIDPPYRLITFRY